MTKNISHHVHKRDAELLKQLIVGDVLENEQGDCYIVTYVHESGKLIKVFSERNPEIIVAIFFDGHLDKSIEPGWYIIETKISQCLRKARKES